MQAGQTTSLITLAMLPPEAQTQKSAFGNRLQMLKPGTPVTQSPIQTGWT